MRLVLDFYRDRSHKYMCMMDTGQTFFENSPFPLQPELCPIRGDDVYYSTRSFPGKKGWLLLVYDPGKITRLGWFSVVLILPTIMRIYVHLSM